MDRPRRSTRAPARVRGEPSVRSSSPPVVPSTSAKATKRKQKENDQDDAESFYHSLVFNPKSLLTRMDISDIVNASAWDMLPENDRAELSLLLPPTAFDDFRPCLDDHHPSVDRPKLEQPEPDGSVIMAEPSVETKPSQPTSDSDAQPMEVDSGLEPAVPPLSQPSTEVSALTPLPSEAPGLNLSIFTDSHFLAAAHTWQDHIYSKWTSEAFGERVKKYLAGVRDGTLAAPWKDEVWERDNQPAEVEEVPKANGKGKGKLVADSSSSGLAGEAKEVRLPTLAKAGVFKVGDIIAYKRTFTQANVTVEKDVIIESIGKSNVLNLLFESGTTKHLPPSLVLPDAQGPDESSTVQSTSITAPTTLETALLDTDGRVDKSKRANSNAWKHFTVYRWRGEAVGNLEDGRGGRESHGTMFYLRGTYYHERW